MLTLSSLKTRRAANPRLSLYQFATRFCFITALSALSAMGIGCMVGPNYNRPAVEQPLYFKSQAASGEAPLMAREWWRLYDDLQYTEVEGADHTVGRDDRDAQEGAHVGMAARPPAAKARMLVHVALWAFRSSASVQASAPRDLLPRARFAIFQRMGCFWRAWMSFRGELRERDAL